MHANTKVVNLLKTRYFDDILTELKQTINILHKNNQSLAGIHIEATYENVTECLGGIEDKITDEMLDRNYKTYCDPRLNFQQVRIRINKNLDI